MADERFYRLGDDEDFARLDVTLVRRTDEIHRAGLRAHDVGIVEPAKRERPKPMRIAVAGQATIDLSIEDAERVWRSAIERYFARRVA